MILILSIVGCSDSQVYPKDFNFTFEYGSFYNNILNTFEGTYTKDLVMNGAITTELNLTEKEKKQIYKLMKDINLFNYLNEIEGLVMEPTSGYRFEIQYNGKKKIINWKGEFTDRLRDKEFIKMTTTIIEIIQSKEAYKLLPPIQGSYE
ncbi:hypothetical protein Back11_17990 [Paenibacillus baekrokdamisoli]|uniref:Uncharacterized protein n=1 Tax=Paenibacillus baekrokdamisoli TaxID=1712516 RepID=A0A3G9JAY7_9BACL|nr:hypothetical protein Back11_17990 [Paenibacillus baekrokdamisoli]